MKYFFHLIAILFTAFILAALYEIYAIRGGEIGLQDSLEVAVEKGGGWDMLLKGEGFSFRSFFDKVGAVTVDTGDDENKEKSVDEQEIDFALGVIDDAQFGALGLDTATERYQILEYCTPGVDVCKDAYDQGIKAYFEDTISGSRFTANPYLLEFGGVDERIWAGLSCLEGDDKEVFMKMVQDTKNISLDTLSVLTKKIKMPELETCMNEANIRLQLRTTMKTTKDIFAISVLPTYIVLDSEEGRWIKIAGLYKQEQITGVLEKEFPLLQ